jgi:hypothetical protein
MMGQIIVQASLNMITIVELSYEVGQVKMNP